MKKTSLILFLAGIFITSHAQTLTKEFLTKNDFIINGEPFFNYKLTFNANNTYTLDFGVEGIPFTDSGSYQVKNDVIYMHCIKSDSAFKEQSGSAYDLTAGNCSATLIHSDMDLYYTQYLEVKTLSPKSLIAFSEHTYTASFPVPGSEVPTGSSRKADRFEIITTGMKKTITTDHVKIRDQPSKNGKALQFLTDWYGGDEFPSVPKGTEVTLIGHTPMKEKIDKYEDYWYYVNVGAAQGVWMYGAFFDLTYQPKEDN